MSELTPKMQWPFPSKDRDNYYAEIVSLMLALDSSGFAAREDRNVIYVSDAVFSWDAASGLLSWNSEIVIFVPTTGRVLSVPSGTALLQLGQVLYVDLVRGSLSNQVISKFVGSVVPATDAAFLLAFRYGSNVFFSNGRSLADGDIGAVLAVSTLTGGGGGGGGGGGTYVDSGAVAVCDAVNVNGSDQVQRADATSAATAPVAGFVSFKPTVATSKLIYSGELGGFVGLVAGASYFLDVNPGQITQVPPALPADAGTGKIVQRVGIAKNATTLIVQIDPSYVVL